MNNLTEIFNLMYKQQESRNKHISYDNFEFNDSNYIDSCTKEWVHEYENKMHFYREF